MASILDFRDHKRRRERSSSRQSRPRSRAAKSIQCTNCGEHHPFIRLAGGELRCVTAFYDGKRWFCRNRGCRQAWLDRRHGESGSGALSE